MHIIFATQQRDFCFLVVKVFGYICSSKTKSVGGFDGKDYQSYRHSQRHASALYEKSFDKHTLNSVRTQIEAVPDTGFKIVANLNRYVWKHKSLLRKSR